MAKKALMLLLKAFKREDWANEFIDGVLYCNTLSFHRKLDDQEGAAVITRDDTHKLEIGGYDLTKDFISLTHHTNMADYINVFCMYSWSPPFVDKERIIVDKESQLGGLRALENEYGPHTVLIRKIPEFARRLMRAVDNAGIPARIDFVKYNLYNRLPTTWEEAMELAFHKNPNYAGENEYRIALIPNREEPGCFRFDLGSIRDIATLTRTSGIYDSLELNGAGEF